MFPRAARRRAYPHRQSARRGRGFALLSTSRSRSGARQAGTDRARDAAFRAPSAVRRGRCRL